MKHSDINGFNYCIEITEGMLNKTKNQRTLFNEIKGEWKIKQGDFCCFCAEFLYEQNN